MNGLIVSLLANATEIVAALRLTDRLVAVRHQCDYPTEVSDLPVCSAPKINTRSGSRDIDWCVKELVERGLSVYRVESEKLCALSPNLLISQSQCEVCAVSERDLEVAVANWTNGRPKIVSLQPDHLLDVWRDISNVAFAASVEKASAILMAAGNWIFEMVEMAGGINLFRIAGKHSTWMKWDQLATADSDVIFVLPCGFDIARSRLEKRTLTATVGWTELKAVCERRVF